jgi:hypothetical protein
MPPPHGLPLLPPSVASALHATTTYPTQRVASGESQRAVGRAATPVLPPLPLLHGLHLLWRGAVLRLRAQPAR